MQFSGAIRKSFRLVVAALVLCISNSMNVSAQQSKAPNDPSGNKPNQEVELLARLQGRWSCEGVFPLNGKHIASKVVFASDLENAWLLVRHDDLPPNIFHSSEYWGFDLGKKQFVAFVFDNFGGVREFTSSGWEREKLIWTGDISKTTPPRVERFVYELDRPDRLLVNWEVKEGTANWRVGDTLTCKR